MSRVIISAGHTNTEPGTVIGDLREVDLARKIAKSVLKSLRSQGVMSLSVPYDLELPKRINWVNNTGYLAAQNDIFVEIHINEGGKSGVEAWYVNSPDGTSSRSLANTIAGQISSGTGLTIQAISDEKSHLFGGISILQQVKALPVLLECLYIDNQKDQEFLENESQIEKLGNSIAKGISEFLGIIKKDSPIEEKSIESKSKEPKLTKSKSVEPRPTETRSIQPKQAVQASAQAKKPDFPSTKNTLTDTEDDIEEKLDKDIDDGFDTKKFPSTAPSGFPTNYPPANNTYGNNNNYGINPSGSFTPPPKTMTRDERKDMINRLYKKGLGKEPSQSDLNYFLNIGVTEEQFLKRIIDSQDHVDMVDAASKYGKLKEDFDQLSAKNLTTERNLIDQKQILEKLQLLLQQKNFALTQMQRKIQLLVAKIEDLQQSSRHTTAKVNYKPNFLDRIFYSLSKRLS